MTNPVPNIFYSFDLNRPSFVTTVAGQDHEAPASYPEGFDKPSPGIEREHQALERNIFLVENEEALKSRQVKALILERYLKGLGFQADKSNPSFILKIKNNDSFKQELQAINKLLAIESDLSSTQRQEGFSGNGLFIPDLSNFNINNLNSILKQESETSSTVLDQVLKNYNDQVLSSKVADPHLYKIKQGEVVSVFKGQIPLNKLLKRIIDFLKQEIVIKDESSIYKTFLLLFEALKTSQGSPLPEGFDDLTDKAKLHYSAMHHADDQDNERVRVLKESRANIFNNDGQFLVGIGGPQDFIFADAYIREDVLDYAQNLREKLLLRANPKSALKQFFKDYATSLKICNLSKKEILDAFDNYDKVNSLLDKILNSAVSRNIAPEKMIELMHIIARSCLDFDEVTRVQDDFESNHEAIKSSSVGDMDLFYSYARSIYLADSESKQDLQISLSARLWGDYDPFLRRVESRSKELIKNLEQRSANAPSNPLRTYIAEALNVLCDNGMTNSLYHTILNLPDYQLVSVAMNVIFLSSKELDLSKKDQMKLGETLAVIAKVESEFIKSGSHWINDPYQLILGICDENITGSHRAFLIDNLVRYDGINKAELEEFLNGPEFNADSSELTLDLINGKNEKIKELASKYSNVYPSLDETAPKNMRSVFDYINLKRTTIEELNKGIKFAHRKDYLRPAVKFLLTLDRALRSYEQSRKFYEEHRAKA